MAGVEVTSSNSPDETRQFADTSKGEVGVHHVAGHPVLYATFNPGWRWSEHVQPIAGTDSCQATHFLYAISGRMAVKHDDGTEAEFGPGDIGRIEPGHDAWVVGDEPFVSIDFGGYGQYAAPH